MAQYNAVTVAPEKSKHVVHETAFKELPAYMTRHDVKWESTGCLYYIEVPVYYIDCRTVPKAFDRIQHRQVIECLKGIDLNCKNIGLIFVANNFCNV